MLHSDLLLMILIGYSYSKEEVQEILRGATYSLKWRYMELQEELRGVARLAPWSHKRSCMESQEKLCGVIEGVLWRQEELPGVKNFVLACFPPF